MKRLLLLLLVTLSLESVGQILLRDSISGEAILGATIRVQDSEGRIDYMTSDQIGRVELTGRYPLQLYISSLGYFPREITLLEEGLVTLRLKPSLFSIDPAVITGQYEKKAATEAVQKIHVITKTEIDQVQAVTLRDILLIQNNIQITQDLALGTNTKINGLSGSQVKILVDGVPVIGRLDGNVDLDQINLDNVVRIEIIEGPMSVEYGTDAIAGAINIITTKSELKNSCGFQSQYETVGRWNTSAFGQGNIGKTGTFVNLGRNYFDGFSIVESERSNEWKPKEQYFGNLALNRRFGKYDFKYKADIFQETLFDEGRIFYQNELIPVNDSITDLYSVPYATDADFTTVRFDNTLLMSVELDSFNSITAHAAYNYYRRERYTFRKNLSTLEEIASANPDDQDTTIFDQFNSRGKWVKRLKNRNVQFLLGYEYQNESTRGKRISDSQKQMTDISGFLSSEIHVSEFLILRPGIRYIENSSYEAPLIPSFNLRYKKGKLNFRASYGRGFRAPSLKELYFFFVDSNHNIQGADDLEAEISDSYQASVTLTNVGENWLIRPSASVFYNEVQNLINLALIDPETQLYRYVNLNKVKTRGVNASCDAVNGNYKMNFGFTYSEVLNSLGTDHEGAYFGVLQARLGCSYIWQKPRLTFNLQLNHRGSEQLAIVDEDGGLSFTENDAYSISSMNVKWDVVKSKVSLSSGVNNIFDVTSINSSVQNSGAHTGGSASIPVSTGRTLVFGLNLNF